MEDIIQILFLGITVISVVHQLISPKEKKKPSSSPQTVLTEPFPIDESDEYLAEETSFQEVRVELAEQQTMKCSHNNNTDPWNDSSKNSNLPATETQHPHPSRQEPNQARISLRSPQDARRAFLASEIFQRKYE